MEISRAVVVGVVVLAAAQPGLAAGSGLVVLDWAGYEDPEFYKSYTEKHGQPPPTFSLFGDDEEGFNKLRAGFRADVAHPCGQFLLKWEPGWWSRSTPPRLPNGRT